MENIPKIISELAIKLNVATEVLWKALLRQALIDAFTASLFFILLVYSITIIIKATKASFLNGKIEEDNQVIVIIIVSGVVLLLGTIALCCFNDAVTSFINPEYTAMKRILRF